MAADRLPSIGPLLRLDPPEHEAAFWRSDTFRAAAHSHDIWALYMTLVTNSLYIRWHVQLSAAPQQHAYIALDVGAALLQQLWARRAPHHYRQRRWLFIWLMRLARLLAFASIPHLTRRILSSPEPYRRLTLLLTPPPSAASTTPPAELLTALRYLPLASSSAIAFIHGISNPLPFRQQVAVHAVYTALAAIYQLRPALAILRLLPAEPFQQVCLALNLALQLTSTTLVGSTVDLAQANRECGARAAVLLVLFTDLYCCLLLPAYVAYRYEAAVKHRYVLAVQQARLEQQQQYNHHQQPAPWVEEAEALELVVEDLVYNIAEAAWPSVLDVLLGMFMAAAAWVAVLFVHGAVEAAAAPL